ncbi:hypothetical protein [Hymenobacter canadensis]|uniref:Uncharacterized protein n=1 Tax=Hymenobacter canadensis TaxID=2999067 RepID=A0ABY7LXT2_9BACT|nr:hypothetical protein [Hymenobacter canadensis]WBA44080.1 hypothetical protein O3303_19510 [Hymenobacter canadensis]
MPCSRTIVGVLPVSFLKELIDLQGEFNFSGETLSDARHFDLGALLTVEWQTTSLVTNANI